MTDPNGPAPTDPELLYHCGVRHPEDGNITCGIRLGDDGKTHKDGEAEHHDYNAGRYWPGYGRG